MQAEPVNFDIFASDPDAVLMAAVQKGDKAAFESIIRKYYPRVFNFFYALGIEPDAAEELAQGTFILVMRGKSAFRSGVKFSTWLYTFAVRSAVRYLRKVKPQALYTSRRSGAGEENNGSQLASKVAEALARLPEKQRIAVFLRRQADFPYEEISKAMGVRPGVIKPLLSEARRNLRRELAPFVNTER